MKITDFFVSGFGIFSGSGARLSGGLTVFQGENESGKTTLMNFFRRLLFSRGKNGRGKTNLYEPQRGGQHGGSARIRMEDGREYILSVEGQKNYIAPADGGPAAELSPDFFSISREVYESVFAMGLGEMQSLDPLNSSDVAARFFAAGAGLGSASLPRLLSVLEARQNELYRPWGNARSASTVNRLLASMAETDGAVRDLRELNGSWRRMKDDLSAMEASMEEKKERLDVLKRRTARLELLEKARPSREALVETERKLAGLEGLHPFPDDGLSRLERLKEEKERIGASIARLGAERSAKEEGKAVLEADPVLGCLSARQEVEGLEHESEQFRASLARRILLAKEIEDAEKAFRGNLENLCSWWTEDHLSGADVSAEAIEFARRTAERKERLERRKGEEEKSLVQWNRLREDRRSEAASLDRETAGVEVRAKRATERWSLITDLRAVFGELCDEEEDLANLEEARTTIISEKAVLAEEEPPEPGTMVALISGALLAVGGGGTYQAWLTSDRLWFFGAVALFSASLLSFIAHRDQQKRYETALSWWTRRMDDLDLRMEETLLLLESQKARVERLRSRREELGERLGIRAPRFANEMDELLEEGERDNSANERFAVLSERSRQMAAVLARMDSESEAMESALERTAGELDRLMDEWRRWLAGRQFDRNLAPKDMEALVPRILQLRSEKSVIESRKAELRELDSYVASVRQRILSLADLFSGAGVELPEEPDPSSIRSLAVALRLAGERKGEIADLERDLAALSASLAELRENLEGNGGKTAELFTFAGSENEERYRDLAARWTEREMLLEDASRERKVLLGLFGSGEEMEKAGGELLSLPAEDGRKERDRAEEEAAVLEREIEAAADSRGRLALRLEQIAADERLGELLFSRTGMDRKLDEGVKEWLSVILARHFLEVSKEKHERERQPEVIRRAGKYLALMTGNRYTLLSSGGERGLSVVLEGNDPARERKDEIKWSSGLADQVYLAMRLSLATLWGRNSEPLPLILDDLLVRFDETRQQGAAEAILEAAANNQVLLFTCQKKTLDIFRTVVETRGTSPDFLAFHYIERGAIRPVL